MKLAYPCAIVEKENECIVSFKDFTEIITSGESLNEALSMATEALNTTVAYYLEKERTIPLPSNKEKNEFEIHLKPSLALSLAIKLLRLKDGLTQKELADRLGVSQPMIRKMEKPNKQRRIETFVNALDKLGGDLVFEVVERNKRDKLSQFTT